MGKIAIQGKQLGVMVEQVVETASDQFLDRHAMQDMNNNITEFGTSVMFSQETASTTFPDMNRLALDFT